MGREVGKLSLLLLLVAVGLFGHSAAADEAKSGSPLPITLERVGPALVEVRSGDHLWSISKDRLKSTRRSPITNAEVSPYWRRVVKMNTPRLKSGNPDLIFPGETVLMPPAS